MKVAELRDQSDKALQEQLGQLRSELAQLYVDQRTKEFKKNHQFRALRQQIAQIQTVLREKQLIEDKSRG